MDLTTASPVTPSEAAVSCAAAPVSSRSSITVPSCRWAQRKLAQTSTRVQVERAILSPFRVEVLRTNLGHFQAGVELRYLHRPTVAPRGRHTRVELLRHHRRRQRRPWRGRAHRLPPASPGMVSPSVGGAFKAQTQGSEGGVQPEREHCYTLFIIKV